MKTELGNHGLGGIELDGQTALTFVEWMNNTPLWRSELSSSLFYHLQYLMLSIISHAVVTS
jgi:hypothetical protein